MILKRKHKTGLQMKMLRHLIILMAFISMSFGLCNTALGESWNGTQTSGSYTLDGNVTVNSTVNLSGGLYIRATGNYTITRNFNGTLFNCGNNNIQLQGYSDKKITIDGGARYSTSFDARTNVSTRKYGDLINSANGAVDLDYVVMQNSAGGRAIHLHRNATTTENCTLDNVLIRGIRNVQDESGASGYGGTAIFFAGGDYHKVVMTGVEVCYCYGYPYGNITSDGGACTILTLSGCYLHHNKAAFGGAIFWNCAGKSNTKATITGNTRIEYNEATGGQGGGIFNEVIMDIVSATIKGNQSPLGAGIYLQGYDGSSSAYNGSAYSLTVGSAVTICENIARDLGGGVLCILRPSSKVGFNTSGSPINVEYKFELDGGKIYGNQAPKGAGVAIDDHSRDRNTNANGATSGLIKKTINITSGQIYGNIATGGSDEGGAGIFINRHDGGTNIGTLNVNISGGEVFQNEARNTNGGGFCIKNNYAASYNSICNVNVSGTTQIYGNTCTGSGNYGNGAGIYLDRGTFIMTGGTIGKSGTTQVPNSNPAQNKDNKNAASNNGGGFYITGGNCTIQGGTISYNEATNSGGGFYVNPGSGATTYINSSSATADIHHNKAANGGATYAATGTLQIESTSTNIHDNTATSKGGGVYVTGTTNFYGGHIDSNKSTSDGGGVYLASTSTLNISGTATIMSNNTSSGDGGGVYQGGTMSADGTSLKISGNTKGTAKALSDNNVYLPTGKTIAVGANIGYNSVEIGVFTQNTSTPIPVLTGAATTLGNINTAMHGGTSKIKDDKRTYLPYYPSSPGNILYFDLAEFDYGPFSSPPTNPITTAQQLYQFMCYVNGVNGYSTATPNAEGILGADINMSGITKLWIPIGETNLLGTTSPYTGSFNGNGYRVSGLTMTKDSYYYKNYGLFGTTEGANIHDVYVVGCNFSKSGEGNMGCIVGDMRGGSITNSTCSGTLTASTANCITGGMVGKLEKNNSASGTIHSSYAGTTQKGYQMGGLVGDMASGCNLYNSFANGKFTAQSGSTKYMGGLVGVNAGRIENCYARIQNTSNPSSDYFGWIAGQNNSGTITYCYIPTTSYSATYVKNGTAADNKCTTYEATSTPYLYKHIDNQMTANANNSLISNGAMGRYCDHKGLMATLNNWVNQDVAHSSVYTPWMRTSASPINGDYPIFNRGDAVCVGSPDNVGLEYHTNFNTKFSEYITANSGTIYLYQSPTAAVTSTLSNSGGVPALYIHEDVVMMHSSTIKAHVGITLDNSAGTAGANPSFAGQGYTDNIDWHFFSSALADAPIGLEYGDNEPYEAYHYPSWQAHFTNANGYFPTNFNTSTPSASDYYYDWDLYAYCEPDYHWINLKRNSASHWHEDYPGEHITYDNDTEFVPGKGYMVALKEEGYLQAYGTLNTNTGSDFLTVPVSYTPEIAWTTREGHNLLGNPYQSYLDFNAFARDEQNATLWNAGRTPFYIILDEDQADYVLYTVGQSPNESQASRFLHPHQGFMIDVDKAGNARFSNDMRTTTTTVSESGTETTWPGYFRSESNPCYPLVNLFATDSYGNRDIVTVELGRPDKGGALKQDAWRMGKGSLWCRYEDEDYALVFTQPGLEYANIRFAADEDAEFTMTWSTHNGEFSYLHLIDNMTGADIDCLSESEYTFSARESDYNSRFRLVFDYTGIDDHEIPEPVEGPATFAYYANGEIHLTSTPDATAQLQIIDMTGRTIVSRDGVHTVSTTGLAAGVYVLRLTDGNGTRTQKIILN